MTTSGSVGPTHESVDAFIAANDPDGSMATLDPIIAGALPGAARVLWQGVFWGGTSQSIIGYGNTEQHRPKGQVVRWFVVGLARQKNYLSLYVNAAQDGQYLSHLYRDRLGKVKVGAASISFASADDLDLEVLEELVRHAGRLTEWT